MQDSHSATNEFLEKITGIIEDNLSNEKFGVSELASEVGMSRSNLLRKIKKQTKLSASVFIRQVRLINALKLLQQSSLNVSEVSYQVGFGSTSYFIKCFHDYYGYPPGETGKRNQEKSIPVQIGKPHKKRTFAILVTGVLIVISASILVFVVKPFQSKHDDLEKSIAVLPFINDSDDPSNTHIINGLMESILNDLQKIEDLRVISRTSVEKYRNNPKTIPEIAGELNVNYLVEGSGQKNGDEILLNIQLIQALTDKHLWSEQYKREVNDIFELQTEVAKNIAGKIEAIITPEEEARIEKIPTDNLVAYDYFLQGLDLFYQGNAEDLAKSITYFEKAIEQDNEFARAYADIAIAYYYLDFLQADRQFSDQINNYADKALLFDPKLPQSLIAKALYYMYNNKYDQALPHLEKALEYNPNSAMVINFLSDLYANYIPDTEKYLEYALRGIQLDIASHDSVTASFIYLHVSNALAQSGFIEEAEKYIEKSLDYFSDNLYSQTVKAYILYAVDKDLQQTRDMLTAALSKDSTRLDIIQEVGKIAFYMRDYPAAYRYYIRFMDMKEGWNKNIYQGENAKIGLVLSEMGLIQESDSLFAIYKEYAENDKSVYKHLSLTVYYSYKGDIDKAIENLELFSLEENYFYWIILFLKIDPLVDNIRDHPEFYKLLQVIEINFWRYHKQIKTTLKKKKLLQPYY